MDEAQPSPGVLVAYRPLPIAMADLEWSPSQPRLTAQASPLTGDIVDSTALAEALGALLLAQAAQPPGGDVTTSSLLEKLVAPFLAGITVAVLNVLYARRLEAHKATNQERIERLKIHEATRAELIRGTVAAFARFFGVLFEYESLVYRCTGDVSFGRGPINPSDRELLAELEAKSTAQLSRDRFYFGPEFYSAATGYMSRAREMVECVSKNTEPPMELRRAFRDARRDLLARAPDVPELVRNPSAPTHTLRHEDDA